jgi:signal transduction histidine kinase
MKTTLLRFWRWCSADLVVTIAGTVVSLTSAAVLLGWILNFDPAKNVFAKLPEMMPLTAVGLTLAGLALAARRNELATVFQRRLATICACGASLIGFVTLAENAFCWDLGMDRLSTSFLTNIAADEEAGRPSFHSAVVLSLLGPALLLLDFRPRRGPQPAQFLALVVLHILIIVFIGYVFNNRDLYKLDRADSGIAIHTALLAALLSIGILCARPDRGFSAIMSNTGGAGIVARRLVFAPITVPFVVGFASLAIQWIGLSKEFSVWSFIVGVFAISTFIIWWVASIIREAEDKIRRLNAELEQRVLERTAELAEANRELQQKNGENEMFVYSVSHDLRSPLVNLQGFSKELDKGCRELTALFADEAVPAESKERGLGVLNGKMAKSLGFIQSAVLRLSSIIDALLRLSRAGRVEYRKEFMDVSQLVNQVVKATQGTISEKGARVTVGKLAPALGDRTALEQVFANLLSNALTYLDPARPGEIEIGCLSPDTNHAPEGFRIYYVKDNGLGIAEAHRAKIFQVFQRAHPHVGKGEGIGLAIVARVAERHRGRVWVESCVGAGSTFFVLLPATAEKYP